MDPESTADAEIRRVSDVIGTLCRLCSVSLRELERRTNLSSGYLTRILRGDVRLRLGLVLEICQILDIPPGLFFATLFPYETPSDSRTRALRAAIELHPPISTPLQGE